MRLSREYMPPSISAIKFVRVKEDIYVPTKPGMVDTILHTQLVRGQEFLIVSLRLLSPTSLDGGMITFKPRIEEITVSENSGSLSLPVVRYEDESRKLTAEVVQEIFPNWHVTYDKKTAALTRGRILLPD